MSRSSIGTNMKQIYMQQVFCGMSILERDRKLMEIIKLHSNEIFECNNVNKTIQNIIGKKRSEHIVQLSKKISDE